jgi:acetyltransferase-like isoleucine patch superfamily enzyme
MIALSKIFLYLCYKLTQHAPVNNQRVFFLKKMQFVQIGKDCYIGPNITITPIGGEFFQKTYDRSKKLLRIGDRVGTGPNVSFICSSHPEQSEKLLKMYGGVIAPITIEDDVWIGANAIILPGVTLHECCFIGAGAVVTKDIPPYTIVAGVPARPIRTLTGNE